MILYGKLAAIEKDEIYVCAHCTDDGYKIDEFAVFAYPIYTSTDGVMLRRFQKFGKLEYSMIFMSLKEFKYYYKPLNILMKGDK